MSSEAPQGAGNVKEQVGKRDSVYNTKAEVKTEISTVAYRTRNKNRVSENRYHLILVKFNNSNQN